MKQLAFGAHALFQMSERGISKEMVSKAFQFPEEIIPARKGRNQLVSRARSGLYLPADFSLFEQG